ncbi:helix-turn-helix domain-containing protein [Reichenbachiella ulvae]|uniref:AraC family transcriptional regulator n=1 Tax=Reichenbachiella ulvae TaxID=2980104 RepID=A0ABT3CTA8_9BACT|nr:AraC family transcriptional regulator [Reichenbachiella ulvae]MCV9386754.1 AraC family transcriptional regulator [Reichenbachiella ulvae]
MTSEPNQTLVNPQTGHLAFKIYSIEGNNPFDHLQRLNYFSLIWIQEGSGTAKVDFASYSIEKDTLFSLSPYQPFMLDAEGGIKALVIHFHPDFFCIHKHQKEVACDGVLFNNIYSPPMVQIDESAKGNLQMIIGQMKEEVQNQALAQYELLVSYLKIFLITASRLKTEQSDEEMSEVEGEQPFVLQKLKDYINEHYKTKHSAGEYADMLAMSPKALAKLTKTHFNKTLSDMIAERIVIEAKRELYLTDKTVKEIAYELGYDDEYYFSRFFKKKAEVSPQLYRETLGSAKAKMN